ncbi:MAG: Tad domain-containing protein, partial [Pseudomonadota bacterium]
MRDRFNKKGQIAILIAMSFGLIFLLIAMVVNIGFLVAAKINLQNAVDLAAYAGAAQQARYLTEIGKWNYEMRRNYKAMSFDYMVAMNAERQPAAFKDYMTNGASFPIACASLQRQGGGPPSPFSISILCQKFFDPTLQPVDFNPALQQSDLNLYNSTNTLGDAIASGSPLTIAAAEAQWEAAHGSNESIIKVHD